MEKFYLWFVAIAFFWEQNNYFGWNPMAKSDAELIADGITLILISIAIYGSRNTKLIVNIYNTHPSGN